MYNVIDPNYEARVRESFGRQGFMAALGATIARVAPGFCEIHIPFASSVAQQHGYFHGGVIGAAADNAAAYAAFTLIGPTATVLTVEYKVNFLAPANGGLLVAEGRVLRTGRTLLCCKSDLSTVDGADASPCAVALATIMILIDRPDRPGDGRR
jgi:uncharacterized protein (TIGR00369 family)